MPLLNLYLFLVLINHLEYLLRPYFRQFQHWLRMPFIWFCYWFLVLTRTYLLWESSIPFEVSPQHGWYPISFHTLIELIPFVPLIILSVQDTLVDEFLIIVHWRVFIFIHLGECFIYFLLVDNLWQLVFEFIPVGLARL